MVEIRWLKVSVSIWRTCLPELYITLAHISQTHPLLGLVPTKVPTIVDVTHRTDWGLHNPQVGLILPNSIGIQSSLMQVIHPYMKRLRCSLHEPPTLCQRGVLSTAKGQHKPENHSRSQLLNLGQNVLGQKYQNTPPDIKSNTFQGGQTRLSTVCRKTHCHVHCMKSPLPLLGQLI